MMYLQLYLEAVCLYNSIRKSFWRFQRQVVSYASRNNFVCVFPGKFLWIRTLWRVTLDLLSLHCLLTKKDGKCLRDRIFRFAILNTVNIG